MLIRFANPAWWTERILLLLLTASVLLAVNLEQGAAATAAKPVTMPLVPTELSPIEELRISDNAYAAVRKPPGQGPFPTVIILHGGGGHSSMEKLREESLTGQAHARFLAWGYITVTATRREARVDPQDRGVIGDTLAIIHAVRKMPEVDPNSIVLFGASGGGTLALEVAGKTQIAAVVAGEPATIIYMGMYTKEHVDTDSEGRFLGNERLWDVMEADPKTLYTPKLREHTRRKLAEIQCPVLILHGDQHPLWKFNLGVFMPEMKALGKSVEVRMFPGEPHDFYFGRTNNPLMALKAQQEAAAFSLKHIKTQPRPIDESYLKHVPAENKLPVLQNRRPSRGPQ